MKQKDRQENKIETRSLQTLNLKFKVKTLKV